MKHDVMIPGEVERIAPCPSCGSDAVDLWGDGYGNVAVRCAACACTGPLVSITDDFAAADRAALVGWAQRTQPKRPPHPSPRKRARGVAASPDWTFRVVEGGRRSAG